MRLLQRIAQRAKQVQLNASDLGTVAAVAFAAVLFKVVQSSAVQDALSSLIRSALNVSL
jgi:hypothetical protein